MKGYPFTSSHVVCVLPLVKMSVFDGSFLLCSSQNLQSFRWSKSSSKLKRCNSSFTFYIITNPVAILAPKSLKDGGYCFEDL